MAGAVTAAVTAAAAVASVGVGAYEASVASGAAADQHNFQMSQLQMEQQLFGEQQGYAGDLNKLLADPSSVSKLPGYQFFKQQGEESIARQNAANPGGAEGVALLKYGQDYASKAYGQQAQLLASLSGLEGSAASFGEVGAGAGKNVTASNQQSFDQINQLLTAFGGTAKYFGSGQTSLPSSGTPAATFGGS